MAVTRLKRKAKRNKARAKVRNNNIQLLSAKPIIKKVDTEAMKEDFTAVSKKPVKKEEAPKVEAKVAEPVVEKEAKEAPKKAAAKAVKKEVAEEKSKKKAEPKAKKEDTEEKPKKKTAPKKDK